MKLYVVMRNTLAWNCCQPKRLAGQNLLHPRFHQRAERPRLLERAARAQDERVGADRADDLQADRKTRARQAAGNGGRMAGTDWQPSQAPLRPGSNEQTLA
jgi:hypothetical protein